MGNSLLLKVMGYTSALGYQYFTSVKTYFYFRNAGYSIRRMYIYTFLFDLLIYVLLIILYSIALHGFAYLKSR